MPEVRHRYMTHDYRTMYTLDRSLQEIEPLFMYLIGIPFCYHSRPYGISTCQNKRVLVLCWFPAA